MPHITLQYSKNMHIPNVKKIFKEIHELLVTSLHTQLSSCKSRALQFNDYLLADSEADEHAFVHLEVAILPGRSSDILDLLSKNLVLKLKEHLLPTNNIKVDISVEVRNLSEFYNKS